MTAGLILNLSAPQRCTGWDVLGRVGGASCLPDSKHLHPHLHCSHSAVNWLLQALHQFGLGVLVWTGCSGLDWVLWSGQGFLVWSGCPGLDWVSWSGLGVLVWSGCTGLDWMLWSGLGILVRTGYPGLDWVSWFGFGVLVP